MQINRIQSVCAVIAALLLLPTSSLSAQASDNDREYRSAVQVSFFPPLSSNGLHSGRYTNYFSLNLLAGVSKNERAFTLGGLANVIRNDATGLQIAGLVNYTGGVGRGFQIGGLANIGKGDFAGFQIGGLLNTAADMYGFQLGGLFNVARHTRGVQLGGLFNIAGDMDGFQFGGLFNVAKNVRGVQFASLVNVADHSDYPIGLINIIKDGEMGVAVGYNEIGTVSLTYRSGGRVLYGILGVGYNHNVARSRDAMSAIAGYGAHINILPWLRVNNEITLETIDILGNEESTFKTGYSLLPAFRLGHFEIFGGPGIYFMQSKDAGMVRDVFRKNPLWEKQRASGRVQQAFVGWQAGVQVFW